MKALRSQSEYAEMRIVMATTECGISPMQLALEAGADEYLVKPFDREALEQKLASLGLVG